MDLGAVFPTTDIGTDPAAIRDWAQTAEGLGLRRITAYDHVLGALHADREPPLWGPYTEDDAFHEPFVLFGYLAGQTQRIELATGVLILPQRQTALVAKQAIEIDVLAGGGRVVLGVGTGWNWVEYESLGTTFKDRARRMDEQVELMRRLFTERIVDFTGRYHRVDRAGLLPLPAQPIPIWFGGSAEPSLARAARIGDGYVFGVAGERCRTAAARLKELVSEAGRDPATFPMDTFVDWSAGPESWAAEAQAWDALGGTILSIRTTNAAKGFRGITGSGFTTPAEHIAALETFVRAVRG